MIGWWRIHCNVTVAFIVSVCSVAAAAAADDDDDDADDE